MLGQYKYSGYLSQSGAVMIEFAIIVPFLLLLLIGVVEFGYAYYHSNILNKSVQDGVRYFSDPQFARKGDIDNPIDTNSTSNSANIQAAKNLVIYGKPVITGDDQPLLPILANYTPAPAFYCAEENVSNVVCADATQHVAVTASYNHNLITGDLLSFLMSWFSTTNASVGPTIPLTASSVLRVQ